MIRKFEIRNPNFEIPQPLKGTEGFTLIELVLVIVLLGVLAALLVNPFSTGVKGFAAIETRGGLTSHAREAMTRIVREMRNIQRTGNNAPNITSANASTITFVDLEDNTITFALSGSTVERNSTGLTDQVSNLQFRYFDGSNSELTSLPLSAGDRDNVRRIMVVLTLQEGTETVTMTGQAFLRDLSGL